MQIKTLFIEPGLNPIIRTMDNSLESLQKAVGGLIDFVLFTDENVELVINDEGKILNLPINRLIVKDNLILDYLAGSFLVVGVDYDTGETISLTERQIEKYSHYLERDILRL